MYAESRLICSGNSIHSHKWMILFYIGLIQGPLKQMDGIALNGLYIR